MIEVKEISGDKKPFNPEGIYYELYIEGNKKKTIPKNNLGAEIDAAEKNRNMYQTRANEYESIRNELKTYQ